MYKGAAKVYENLRKQGKARIQIELEAFPDDIKFIKTPPSCRVCVESVPETQNKNDVNKVCKTILVTMLPQERIIEINVESVVSTLERMRHFFSKEKPRPKSLELFITVNPTEKWKHHYIANKSSTTVSAGSKHILIVSLEPTKEYMKGTRILRQKKSTIINKKKGT